MNANRQCKNCKSGEYVRFDDGTVRLRCNFYGDTKNGFDTCGQYKNWQSAKEDL